MNIVIFVAIVALVVIVLYISFADKEYFGEITEPKSTCADIPKLISDYSKCARGLSNGVKIIPDDFVYTINNSTWNDLSNNIENHPLFKDISNYTIYSQFDATKNIFVNIDMLGLYKSESVFLPLYMFRRLNPIRTRNEFSEDTYGHAHCMINYINILNSLTLGCMYFVKKDNLYTQTQSGFPWQRDGTVSRFKYDDNMYVRSEGTIANMMSVIDDDGIKTEAMNQWSSKLYTDEKYKLKKADSSTNYISYKNDLYSPDINKILVMNGNTHNTNIAKILFEMMATYTPMNINGDIMLLNIKNDVIESAHELAKHRYTGLVVFIMGIKMMYYLHDTLIATPSKQLYDVMDTIYNNVVSSDTYVAFTNKSVSSVYNIISGITNSVVNTQLTRILDNVKITYKIGTNANIDISIRQFFDKLHDTRTQKETLKRLNNETFGNSFNDSYFDKMMNIYQKRYFGYFKCGLMYYNMCVSKICV